jgi:6-phosphogluconate dehydrogenase
MENQYEMGMVGLGVMGRNLVLNIADHGFSIAGYDKDSEKVTELKNEAEGRPIFAATSLDDFFNALRTPRVVMMLVPAGSPVDAVIRDVLPFLTPGDMIIDGGNSYYKDTNLRAETLAQKGIRYLGVGISGGESGARHGPSMMPGGPKDAYERVRPIFEAAAAKVDNEPCVAYLGTGSAGHYVKMVHNGIEYGLMELIAETYDLMKRGLGLSDDEIHQAYKQWNQDETSSYLIEISANIFKEVDDKTGKRLIDVILDEAKQKGTGKWTSQSAMDLQVPASTIDMAVAMRDLSVYKTNRIEIDHILGAGIKKLDVEQTSFLKSLHKAYYAAMLLTYAQGMSLLGKASKSFEYNLDLETIARIWRGGCIIRASLLEDIRSIYRSNPDLPNLLRDDRMGRKIAGFQDDLRMVVKSAIDAGIPTPGFMASLAYFDAFRSPWLPANLIQAQRDYFGAHTYERTDAKGVFHTQWEKS